MIVIMWLTLFVVAAAATHQTLTRQLPQVLGAFIGLMLWIILAYASLNLVVIGDGGVAWTDSSQPLAFLCLGGAAVNFVFVVAYFIDELPRGAPSNRGEM